MASEYFPHTIHRAKNTCPQIIVCPMYLLTIWFKESFLCKNCLWEVQTFAAPDLNFTLPSNWNSNTGLVPLYIIDIRFYRPQFTQEPFHPLFCHLKILGCVIFSWLCYFLLAISSGPPVYCAEVGKSNLRILQTDFVPLDSTKFFFSYGPQFILRLNQPLCHMAPNHSWWRYLIYTTKFWMLCVLHRNG